MSRVRVLRPSTPQSFVFYKNAWTVAEARAWLAEHGFKNAGVDRKRNTLRFRQFDPSRCLRDTYGTKTWKSGSRGKSILVTMCRTARGAVRTTRKRKAA